MTSSVDNLYWIQAPIERHLIVKEDKVNESYTVEQRVKIELMQYNSNNIFRLFDLDWGLKPTNFGLF